MSIAQNFTSSAKTQAKSNRMKENYQNVSNESIKKVSTQSNYQTLKSKSPTDITTVTTLKSSPDLLHCTHFHQKHTNQTTTRMTKNTVHYSCEKTCTDIKYVGKQDLVHTF